MYKYLLLASLALTGCGSVMTLPSKGASVDETKLSAVLTAQSEQQKMRYEWRHPQETLTFFGLAPGMTVVEALPGGGGWYSKILVPYLGRDGRLIGLDYPVDMWPHFDFGTAQFIEKRKQWPAQWTADTEGWKLSGLGASAEAYTYSTAPNALDGTADMVLFIRALHNFARFESKGAYLSNALARTKKLLKPGGIVGVVQHQAPDTWPDESADGSQGYLKKAPLIAAMVAAGFEYVGESNINNNPKDQPGAEDIVWRLPPSLATTKGDPAMQKAYQAIGESNRMTLKFRKPK